jgi:hypothetical protein
MADDLAADKTPGFKVGEKKTIDEYQKLGESVTVSLYATGIDNDTHESAQAIATSSSLSPAPSAPPDTSSITC